MQGVAESVGRLAHGAEREALRLEVGVLDREVEHVVVELAVGGKVVGEIVQRVQLGGVAEALQPRRERRRPALDRARRLLGFAGERDRLLVGVGHDGAIGRVRGLGQLDAQIIGQAARLGELRERRIGRVPATESRQAERERGDRWDDSARGEPVHAGSPSQAADEFASRRPRSGATLTVDGDVSVQAVLRLAVILQRCMVSKRNDRAIWKHWWIFVVDGPKQSLGIHLTSKCVRPGVAR